VQTLLLSTILAHWADLDATQTEVVRECLHHLSRAVDWLSWETVVPAASVCLTAAMVVCAAMVGFGIVFDVVEWSPLAAYVAGFVMQVVCFVAHPGLGVGVILPVHRGHIGCYHGDVRAHM